jgi:hypothetical protein
MSGKQQKKPPRPYLKSSHRIEIHKEKNAGEKTTRFLHDLSSYLISVGLERPKSKGKRAKPSPKEEDAKALIKSGARECYSSALPGGQEKPSIFIPNTKEFFPPLKPPKGKGFPIFRLFFRV